jgi:hypothetical protein
MIREFGNYNTRLDMDGTSETTNASQEAELTEDSQDDSVTEVSIGSLLFESPTIYSSLPRRRIRIRSSTVI